MSDPVNKWDQPESAPPPMFFGKKERDLVKQVNDELAERVVGQTIAYYSVSLEDSEFHPIYGEAIDKVTLPPVRVYAYVTVENEQSNERYGYEYQTKLTVNFNRKRLTEDQNLFVRVGDFVQYGDEFYEVVKTYNDTRYYFGQIEHKFQISAECIKAREGVFRIRGSMKPQLVTTAPGVKAAVEPAAAPPPVVPRAPNNAEYLVLTADSGLTKERILTAGDNITFTDGGAGGALTIAATGDLAVSSSALVYSAVGLQSSGYLKVTGSTTLAGLLSSSAAARLVGSLSSSGDIATTGAIHATTYYGDGSNLAGVGSNASGSARQYSATGIETSGYLKVTGSSTLAGALSSSAGVEIVGAATFSNILNVTGAISGAAGVSGSNALFDGQVSSSAFYGDTAVFSDNVTIAGVLVGGSPLKISGAVDIVDSTGTTILELGGESNTPYSSSAGGIFGQSVSSSGDLAVTGNVHATQFYGGGAGITGISSEVVDVTSSAGDIDYPIIFTQAFQSDGSLGLAGNTGLVYNPNDAVLSSSAGIQAVGATTLGNTLNVSGAVSGAVGITGSAAFFDGQVSASIFYGDGSGLTGVDSASGSARHYSSTGFETSGYLRVSGSTTLAGALSSSAGAALVGSLSSSGDMAASGNIHAIAYYGDGSNLAGVSNASGSARHYSSTGLETSGYLKVSGSSTLAGTLSSSAAAVWAGSVSSSGDLAVTGNVHATAYYGDGSNLAGVSDASGSARHYSSTGFETSGYLKVTGSSTLGGAISSSAGAVLVGSISSSNDLAVTGNVHAAVYYGDGSNLSGIAGTASGSARHYSSTGVETSGYLKVSGSTTLGDSLSSSAGAVFVQSLSSSGDVAITGNMHAAVYYGDGSNLSGIAGTASGSARHYSATGLETSGYLRVTGSTTLGGAISASAAARLVGSLSSSANVAVTGNVHATTYYGDGSQLTGIGAASFSGSARIYSATGLETSGFMKVSGSAEYGGGIMHNLTAVTAPTYSILATDYYITADTSANTITLTLPNTNTDETGRTFIIKDVGGNVATNPITIDGYQLETIDGQASFELSSPYGAVSLFTDGASWFIY